ncbi:MAG: methionine biosynthesis protein MetW [Acidimicrobiales bacterium]
MSAQGPEDPPSPARGEPAPAGEEPRLLDDYHRQVIAEIDDEVQRHRGEIPAQLERELDEMFLEHAPVAVRGGDLKDALGMVDRAAFVDPVVPITSQRPAGAAVKKTLRALSLWYMGWVTHQVSTLGLAVSRALHAVDAQLGELRDRVPPPASTRVVDEGSPGSWWVPLVVDALGAARGRVLHTACGDGWLVGLLSAQGVDAYGVDPRPGKVDEAELRGADLRQEDPLGHLRAVSSSSLGGVVISGIVEAMEPVRRDELVRSLLDRIAGRGVLVVHSVTLDAWLGEDAPVEADLAAGRPLRPRTWAHLLATWAVETVEGPDGGDYLVVATR